MKFLKVIAASAVVALSASVADAATYLGYFSGNDSLNDGLYDAQLGIDSPGLWKCEAVTRGCALDEYTDYSTADAFTVRARRFKSDEDGPDYDEAIGGSWSWSGAGELAPHYMVVKGGPGYTVWDVSGETSGFWSTRGLGNSAMSHISFYNTGIPEIPLPASALLLLGGLGGLVALRRRKS